MSLRQRQWAPDGQPGNSATRACRPAARGATGWRGATCRTTSGSTWCRATCRRASGSAWRSAGSAGWATWSGAWSSARRSTRWRPRSAQSTRTTRRELLSHRRSGDRAEHPGRRLPAPRSACRAPRCRAETPRPRAGCDARGDAKADGEAATHYQLLLSRRSSARRRACPVAVFGSGCASQRSRQRALHRWGHPASSRARVGGGGLRARCEPAGAARVAGAGRVRDDRPPAGAAAAPPGAKQGGG